ncbi:MAG: hypothetical protein EBV92_10995, partial [Betaproteobacteria bacterium]|nr:hypothetical protein [Betaproteobacteria bacterium]
LPDELRRDRSQLGPLFTQPRAITQAKLPAKERQRVSNDALREFAARFGGTRRELAQTLGLSERTLYRRLRGLGID